MTKLLVSVRSVEEAVAALEGGADLIDVKEPARGPMGRADDAVIRAVVERVAGRVPVSAAMGELWEKKPIFKGILTKIGLARAGKDWPHRLRLSAAAVPVAYADFARVDAPPVHEVAAYAREHDCPYLLIDTAVKDGSTLFDHVEELPDHPGLVLAGSLQGEALCRAAELHPAVIAVRGCVCEGGREGTVKASLVSRVRETLHRVSSRSEPMTAPR